MNADLWMLNLMRPWLCNRIVSLTFHTPSAFHAQALAPPPPSAIVTVFFFVAGQPVVRVSFLASGLMCSMSVACGALGSPGVLLDAALLDLHTAHQSSFVLKWLNFSTFVWFKLACTLWHYPVYFKCNTKMK